MSAKLIAAEPVTAYQAKTHLSGLLERVERGERFVITRHGRPVAYLGPIEESSDSSALEAMSRVARIRAGLQRKGVRLQDVLSLDESARALAHAGHRF